MSVFQELLKHIHGADTVGNSRHCAAIVHNGSILSIGVNKKKTHPIQKLFADKPEKDFIHAEIDAIVKVKNKDILKECSIHVLRLTKGNRIGNSKPCLGCMNALNHYGIKKIYWTDNGNQNWL